MLVPFYPISVRDYTFPSSFSAIMCHKVIGGANLLHCTGERERDWCSGLVVSTSGMYGTDSDADGTLLARQVKVVSYEY